VLPCAHERIVDADGDIREVRVIDASNSRASWKEGWARSSVRRYERGAPPGADVALKDNSGNWFSLVQRPRS
jgi:hypothetical protein